jgi:hypothetical protein
LQGSSPGGGFVEDLSYYIFVSQCGENRMDDSVFSSITSFGEERRLMEHTENEKIDILCELCG